MKIFHSKKSFNIKKTIPENHFYFDISCSKISFFQEKANFIPFFQKSKKRGNCSGLICSGETGNKRQKQDFRQLKSAKKTKKCPSKLNFLSVNERE